MRMFKFNPIKSYLLQSITFNIIVLDYDKILTFFKYILFIKFILSKSVQFMKIQSCPNVLLLFTNYPLF